MNKQRQVNRWRQPAMAWGCALIMVMILFAMQTITPFGNHNLLIGDLGSQYTAFFTGVVQAIRSHTWTIYNFQQALGTSWVPTIAYYLMSPFNLLLFLFRTSQLPVAISLIIMLKIATIAGSMTLYLQEHFKIYQGFPTILGWCFAFCGFVTTNFFNLMWLDALITLPLVAWGIDRLIVTGTGRGYFWALFASIIVNYYTGYMTCLFVIGYFLYQLTSTSNQPLNRAWWAQQWQLSLKFVGTSLLSGLSTLFLLLPTVISMLAAPKLSNHQGSFTLTPLFGLEFFSQFQMGASNFSQRLSHGPAIFVSSLVVLLVSAYFWLPQIQKRQKWLSIGLLTYLFLGLWIRGFNTVWHMLAVPASYPFRNSFIFSFVLILLAANAWYAGIDQLAHRWRWALPVGIATLMLVGAAALPILGRWSQLDAYVTSLTPWNWLALLVSLVSLAVMAMLLWFTPRKYLWVIVGLVVLELGGNFAWSLVGADYGSQQRYAQAYRQARQRLTAVTNTNQLFRIRQDLPTVAAGFAGHYNGYNDPVWLGYNGTSAYSSTTQSSTMQVARQLGLFVKNDRRLGAVGFTPVTEMLMGVREKINSQGTTMVNSYRGMGFGTSQQLATLKLGTDPIANQEAILQAMLPSRRAYLVAAARGRDQLKITAATNNPYRYHHVWRVTPQTTGRLYLVDPTGQSKFSTLSVNHHLMAPAMKADGSTAIINLGIHQQGRPVLIKFASTGKSKAAVRIATLSKQRFARVQRATAAHQLQLRREQRGRSTVYTGTVRTGASTPQLFLSLPTEAGWRVQVDGQTVPQKTALTGLTTVAVRRGKHRVTITYRVPGAVFGGIISLLALLTYGVARRLKRL